MALAVSARMTFVMLAQVKWHKKVSTKSKKAIFTMFQAKKRRSAFCFACGGCVWTGLTRGFHV
jgi:hypothetical protein